MTRKRYPLIVSRRTCGHQLPGGFLWTAPSLRSITWNNVDPSRHVVHDVAIERLRDHKTLESAGDRLQKPLTIGITEGFSVDGTRSWTSQRGTWVLDIEQVEMRWTDPVPQAGKYLLKTPETCIGQSNTKRGGLRCRSRCSLGPWPSLVRLQIL
ncbi:hypothetical protein ACFL5O_05810 [Myxococcota bacterium]